MRKFIVGSALAVSIAALFASSALAVPSTFATRAYSTIGVMQASLPAPAGASATYYFTYRLYQGRSYHAYAFMTGRTDSQEGVCTVGWLDSTGTAVAGSAIYGDEEPRDFGADGDGFVAATTGEYTTIVTVTGAPAQAAYCDLVVTETTLFAPWFYRDAGQGYDGFVEIKNTSSFSAAGGAQPVSVTAFAANGTATGSTTVSVPNNGTALVTVSTLGATSGGFGSVKIAYPGKPGSIIANLTTLSGSTGLSFDAPFTQRVQTPRY
jgi:hypothetical protein